MKAARFVSLLGLAALLAAQDSARDLHERAREAEKKGEIVRAYLLYAQAAALDPKDRQAWIHSLALRTRAAMQANVLPASLDAGRWSPDDDPAQGLDPITEADLREARELRPPVRLEVELGLRTIELDGDSRAAWEKVAKEYGLEVVFDGDYQPVSDVRFRVRDVDAREALAALELATASFLVPISERMILVARESAQKRQELEPTIAVSVPLPNPVPLPEAQELARTVQQLMDIQKFGIDSVRRVVVIRDRISRVVPALAVFEQLLHYRPDVGIEVEFIEVIENSALDIGLRLQSSFPVVWLSSIWNSTPVFPAGFSSFGVFGSGLTRFGLGITGAEMFANFSKSSGRTLIRTDLRTSDGQAVQFHLGDKYPILTTGYFGPVQGTGAVYTPPPSFNFEDLGVVLKITPKVHGWDEISLEVDGEYKVLTGQALNGIPVIARRQFLSRVRVRSGEWAVLSGLVRASEARAITGVAGLSQIPALGALFRQNNKTGDSGQTLFVIKPRLLSPPLSEVAVRPLWTGSETRPRLGL